jgi:hypothetical protein
MSIPIESCPRFQKCNAPVCPLDELQKKRKHLPQDRVCFFLLESAKTSAHSIFMGVGLGNLYEVIVRHTPAILNSHPRIKRAYEKAKESGSRMARKLNKKAKVGEE